MSSVFDRNLLPAFETVKDSDEEILWTGRPRFIPYVLTGLGAGFFTLLFGIVWIAGVLLLESSNVDDGSIDKYKWMIGLIPLAQGLYVLVKRWLSYSNTAYAYSNKRIMIRSGFIGTDFKAIDYDKIADIEVAVNIIERIYHVGTIRFFTGRTDTSEGYADKLYDSWFSIPDPYEVFKMVKQTSVDIKTDFNYPNALRPETNPGYSTKYERRNGEAINK